MPTDLDSYFKEGQEAYENGLEEEDNPYNLDTETDEHARWNDGWREAFATDHADEEDDTFG